MRPHVLLVVPLLFCANAAVAGLKEGYAALARKDYVTAAKEYRPLAEQGNAEAQYRIGRMYEFGNGYPQDKAQGIAWVRKAADQGHVDAEQELGVVYATGDGVPEDDAQAVAWFRKAAEKGDATAQYNLGLLYAKGAGVPKDYAHAFEWWRKAATQDNADAQFKLAVVYHNGEGAPKDDIAALANATLAARNGDKENIDYRNEIAKPLTAEEKRKASSLASAWKVGQPPPGSVAASVPAPAAAAAAPSAPVKPHCSASGALGGEKFTATHCVASLYEDEHSVAIWFNEDAIAPDEAESFETSSYAASNKGGKERTMAIIMFCPGGGAAAASAPAVRSVDLNTNHARSPMAGIQRVVEGPGLKVSKMTGDVKPGGVLSGTISANVDTTSIVFEFELGLPARDAAAGMSCGK